MPLTEISLRSSTSLAHTDHNVSSLTLAALQGLMTGLGWKDLQPDILAAEAQEQAATHRMNSAIDDYLETPDTHSRAQLITALQEAHRTAQQEYDYALTQLSQYKKEAAQDALQKSQRASAGYLRQWGEWMHDGVKTFFGSTAEQQVEKYANIAAARQRLMDNLTASIAALEEEQDLSESSEVVDDAQQEDKSQTKNSVSASPPQSVTYPVIGQFPATINVSSLDGQIGFKMDGENANDESGYSVKAAGDINRDGYDDVLIGAPYYNKPPYPGRTYIVYGGNNVTAGNSTLTLGSLNGKNGFKSDGEYGRSGSSVSLAGDINWDNYPDVIIGAPDYNFSIGRSYVIFGNTTVGSSGIVSLSSLNGSDGFKLDGTSQGNLAGASVSTAGDMNGDQYSDIIIGAFTDDGGDNNIYVVFGGRNVGNMGYLPLSSLNGTNGFVMDAGCSLNPNRGLLVSVSAAGDVNDDGYADVIIGSALCNNEVGRSYVVFGSPSVGSSGLMLLAELDGSNGFRLDGESNNYYSGRSVSAAGDINRDGYDDLLIGCYGYYSQAASYVVFGEKSVGSSGSLFLGDLDGTNGFKVYSGVFGAVSTNIVSAAGDVNGDGYADIIIGMPSGTYGSASFLIFGSSNLGITGRFDLSSLDGVNGFALHPETSVGYFVTSVSGAGDFNQDGVDDILIGADGYNNYTGRSYLIYGDIPPVLTVNNLSLYSSQTITLSSSNLAAYDRNHNNASLLFIPSNVKYGRFQQAAYPGMAIANFTQQQINDSDIQFVHDGSGYAPIYDVSVRSSGIAYVPPSPAIITFNTLQLNVNQLTIGQEQSVIFNSNNLYATDTGNSQQDLYFSISNLSKGQFQFVDTPDQPISSFTQQNVTSGVVRFVQDDSSGAPSYQVAVSNGIVSNLPQQASVTFYPLPVLVNNNLMVSKGARVGIYSYNLYATSNGNADPNLIFSISSLSNGQFQFGYTGQAISSFTQQNITNGMVSFIQNGSLNAPAYQVTVINGVISTSPQSASVSFFILPIPPSHESPFAFHWYLLSFAALLLPLLRLASDKAVKAYFRHTAYDEMTAAVLSPLWVGTWGIMTSSEYQCYQQAVEVIVTATNSDDSACNSKLPIAEATTSVPLEHLAKSDERRPLLGQNKQARILLANAVKEQVLAGRGCTAYSPIRFFRSLSPCYKEATPQYLEDNAHAIAARVKKIQEPATSMSISAPKPEIPAPALFAVKKSGRPSSPVSGLQEQRKSSAQQIAQPDEIRDLPREIPDEEYLPREIPQETRCVIF